MVFVFVEELPPRRLEVKFNLAGRDPDCLQESLVVLCEHLTSIVQHGWVLVVHRVLVTLPTDQVNGIGRLCQDPAFLNY